MKDYNGNELNVGDKVTYMCETYLLDGTITKITDEWVYILCENWEHHPTHRRNPKNIIKKEIVMTQENQKIEKDVETIKNDLSDIKYALYQLVGLMKGTY